MLVAPATGGPRVTARNRAAQKAGLAHGELLSNARSKVRDLQVRDADPAADAAALARLALWAQRYTPTVAVYDAGSGGDGLFLEVAGSAHLFGGEAAMLEDMARRLAAFGLAPRLGIADTAGAAWAVSHHGATATCSVPPGGQASALQGLPLAALRLEPAALGLLRRLGLKRVGEIMGAPRAPFAARFEADLLRRLDQALGRAPEPLIPIAPPPRTHAQVSFLEPIFASDHVMVAATRLLQTVADDLTRDGAGARLVRLLLFRVTSRTHLDGDNGILSLDIGLAAPSRDVAHIARLVALRLERLGAAALDSDFGFEAAAVHVLVAEPFEQQQSRLTLDARQADPEALLGLVDRLRQRLGAGAVHSLLPHHSHLPERAVEMAVPGQAFFAEAAAPWDADLPVGARPSLLLPQPEAADVVALIPDGPPRQFRWRGVLHQVRQAQGPERITPEWWRRTGEAARDYYLVEDADGRRFWLYRAGLYEPDAPTPDWYVHGVFA